MKANIKYFGMIAEKVGKTEETVDLNEKNQSDIRSYIIGKYSVLEDMNYSIAVNQVLIEDIDKNAETVEIALLPPFAGG